MHSGLPKDFPERQRNELEALTELIVSVVKPVKVILFGSYARGDFVERDITVSDWGIAEVYQSDFDILVITDTEAEAESIRIGSELDRKRKKLRPRICTPLSILRESLTHVNEQLMLNRYFYADIQKEGRVLYERDEVALAKQKKLSEEKKRELILQDVENWSVDADTRYRSFTSMYRRAKRKDLNEIEIVKALNNAAFDLHQVTEKLYTALWLVIKQYKPKTHDLEELAEFVERQDKRLAVFDREEGEGKRLFTLLRKAYVDARYKKSYRITVEELSSLMKSVKKLRKQVLRVQSEI